jgi:hypothetical protein
MSFGSSLTGWDGDSSSRTADADIYLGVRFCAVAADGHNCQPFGLILRGKSGYGLCIQMQVAAAAAAPAAATRAWQASFWLTSITLLG